MSALYANAHTFNASNDCRHGRGREIYSPLPERVRPCQLFEIIIIIIIVTTIIVRIRRMDVGAVSDGEHTLSYMNLVMIDVLPTLWSPRKTSLYFASGALPLEDAFDAAGAPALPFVLIVTPPTACH